MQAAGSTRGKYLTRLSSTVVKPILFALEQSAVKLVSAARKDADVLDIRMFGIEENIRVRVTVNTGQAQSKPPSRSEPLVTDGL